MHDTQPAEVGGAAAPVKTGHHGPPAGAAERRLRGDTAFAAALVGGATVAAAAALAGISERSARRRLADPHFKSRLATLKAEALEGAARRLAALAGKAADRLGQLMDADNAAVALGACQAALESALRFTEATEWESRLAELEKWTERRGR
jgi:hypothetical protein